MMISFYKTGKKNSLYYTVHDRQDSFFHNFTLTTIWGIEVNSGREKVYHFETQKEMDSKIRAIIRDRLRGNYKMLYHFARKEHYKELIDDYIHHDRAIGH